MKEEIVDEITIEEFSKKGTGVGYREDGSLVEVFHTMPGDRVKVSLWKKRRGRYKAKLISVEKPSENRINPPCEHSEICGGCIWQQMGYEEQKRQKEKIVLELFAPLLSSGSVDVYPLLEADKIFSYRNKMEFSFSENAKGDRFLGLMIIGAKRYVFNVKRCHLASFWMSDLLQKVRAFWEKEKIATYNFYKNEGVLRYLTMREGKNCSEKMVILTISDSDVENWCDAWKKSFLSFLDVDEKVSVYLRKVRARKGVPTIIEQEHLSGPKTITEKLHIKTSQGLSSYKYIISPESFFQPNTDQAQKLYQRALEVANVEKEAVVYDLYCGTGTIGMLFSQIAKDVIGIDLNSQAIADGRKNLALNGIENVSLFDGDVGEILQEREEKKILQKADLVIVDPPRAGLMPLAMEQILLLDPKKILYISCNPYTQKENIDEFIESGYRLTILQPVDQFPHTIHIENIALLEKV